MQWRWLIWQVVVPVFGPILISLLVIGLWMSGNPDFVPDKRIILDVTPWALAFYTLALVGSSLNGLWPKLSKHTVIGAWLVILALVVMLYAALTVIWRHNGNFVAGAPVYYVTGCLLVLAVVLCHMSYSRQVAI